VISTIGILVFTAGTMGWFMTRSRMWENVVLVAIAFALFRPGFFMDMVQEPYRMVPASELVQEVGKASPGSEWRLVVAGPDFDSGEMRETHFTLKIEDGVDGAERLKARGLVVIEEDGLVKLDEPFPGTPFFKKLADYDFYADEPVRVLSAQVETDGGLPKELIFIPALLLLAAIAYLQTLRARKQEEATA
jgi:hypothetical protein